MRHEFEYITQLSFLLGGNTKELISSKKEGLF